MPIRALIATCLAAALFGSTATSQPQGARERAKPSYDRGLEQMRQEAFDAAAASFQTAITLDPTHEMAHYMLGRVQLMQRNYTAAVYSLVKSRDLFTAQATDRFTNKAEGDRKRRELINDMTNVITQLREAKQQTPQVVEQIRQYTERRRQLQDLDRESGMSREQAVPGFVSLSLGSAYFRSGKLTEAEEAYLAAIATDSRIGEAHNNLAVVYMETGRIEQAERALNTAERIGFRVSPALKEEIKKRKKT